MQSDGDSQRRRRQRVRICTLRGGVCDGVWIDRLQGHDYQFSDDALVGNGVWTEPTNCTVSGVRQSQDGRNLVEVPGMNYWQWIYVFLLSKPFVLTRQVGRTTASCTHQVF